MISHRLPVHQPVLTGALNLLRKVVTGTNVGMSNEAIAALDYVESKLATAVKQIADLKAELAVAKQDAEQWQQVYKDSGDSCFELQRKVDAAIDAARKEGT